MANRFLVKVVALLLVCLSCQADEEKKEEKTETHRVSRFDNLQVSSALEVNVTVNGDIRDPVLKITAEEKYLPAISYTVVPSMWGGTLYLNVNPFMVPYGSYGSTLGSVAIEVPEPLNSIGANSAASVVVDKAAGDISADSRGSVEVKEMIEPKSGAGTGPIIRTVFFRASSAGSVKVDGGKVEHAFVQASSSAVIDVGGCSIRHARIEASSSATVTVQAVKTAGLTCSSAAAVTIKGTADVSKMYTHGCSVTTDDGKKNAAEDIDATPLFP